MLTVLLVAIQNRPTNTAQGYLQSIKNYNVGQPATTRSISLHAGLV